VSGVFVFREDKKKKQGEVLGQVKGFVGGNVCDDHWRSYEEFYLPEQHVQSKVETFTVERYNSRIRLYLARCKRKTKCYSKSDKMIEISLNLLMEKLNNRKTI